MKFKLILLLILTLSSCLLFPSMGLSDREQILISGSQSYAPFYFRNAQGEITGIFADIWRLWAKKIGTSIEFDTQPFAQVLEDVEQGRADIVAGFFHSAERSSTFGFSKSFYEIPTHIFFHEHIFGLKELSDLTGFTVGVVKGDYAEEFMQKNQPASTLATYDHFDSLIQAAIDGKVNVFICDTPVALFLLTKHGQASDFRHSTKPLYTSKIYAGVKKNDQDLLDLINRGFGLISEKERAEIDQRWQGISATHAFPWGIVSTVLSAFIIVSAVLVLWNYQLRHRVSKAIRDTNEQKRRLENSEKSLQLVNEQLEQRVQQRTLQIQKSNLLLADQISKHSQAEKRLSQNNAYLSALHETMLGLMRRLDLQELLEAIIQRATTATGARHGYVYLKEEDSDALVARIGVGLFATAIGYRLELSEGLAGKVLKNGRYMLVEDYHNWFGRHPGARWDGLGASIGIPLTSGAQIVGVLGLSFMQSEGRFGQDEINFLNGFAELASIALDNARLYEDLQNELAERERNEIERNRLEERIQHAQKMEAIGTLAGGIAHDFNNILAVIMGNLELAMQDTPTGSGVQAFLRNGFQSTIRARDLVQQILTFSRKGTHEMHPIRVEPIIAEGIKLIRASIPTSIAIRQHLSAKDAVIKASPVQIHQVLMNLCANAAHAMEESGGILEFQLKETMLNRDFVAQNPDIAPGQYVQLTISDSGHGIDSEVMPRIFEPYFTTKEMERGTGLGLSVVHGIVQSHHGLITVESASQGTTFDIFLPMSDEPVPTLSDMVMSETGGTESILFVDDEPDLVSASRRALENQGYRVTTCRDGNEALAKFSQEQDQFDLVITDMTMPRMNGDKLAGEILKMRPDMPIIICTGFSHLISVEKAHEIGIRSLLMKPVFLDDLSRTIRSTLDKS